MTVAVMGKAFPISYRSLLGAMAAANRIAAPVRHRTAAPALLYGVLTAAAIAAPIPANAVVPFEVRFESEAPGMQTTTATFNTGGVETFDALSRGNQARYSTDFGTGGKISGTYQNLRVNAADQFGGAGGNGKNAVTFNATGYSLDLSSTEKGGVNYFGYWLSALDAGNIVSFYRGGKLLFNFNPSDVRDALNLTPNPAAYYGNPNRAFAGRKRSEPYVFVNFFLNRGAFDKIVFWESPQVAGYESDNHTVGNFLTKGTGTTVVLSPVPEPAVWLTLIAGFALIGANARCRTRVLTA